MNQQQTVFTDIEISCIADAMRYLLTTSEEVVSLVGIYSLYLSVVKKLQDMTDDDTLKQVIEEQINDSEQWHTSTLESLTND